ncbi:hypothetical protein BCV70DRAFT_196805 [Testicularia cyperi]|uniref:CCHC-type domain-containing protein n=1 Tax=Testicularia cyperi TaxID=1882483 RepID=A0A317XW75_9BASI|nr:hypothetical protein BCV70DRAFT_196805 [Testicularia cyperi]
MDATTAKQTAEAAVMGSIEKAVAAESSSSAAVQLAGVTESEASTEAIDEEATIRAVLEGTATSIEPANWAAGGNPDSDRDPTAEDGQVDSRSQLRQGSEERATEANDVLQALQAGRDYSSDDDVAQVNKAISPPRRTPPPTDDAHESKEASQDLIVAAPRDAADDAQETESLEDGELHLFGDDDGADATFVLDTQGDMDVDREAALDDELRAKEQSETHTEAGLLLPNHVNIIGADRIGGNAQSTDQGGANGQHAERADETEDAEVDLHDEMGDYEQLDQDPSSANRYYGAEEKAERRAKEQCVACGEFGHDRRHCPHMHCLACGAMDEHPTRSCPMSTSCFRCGKMGHQTRNCPQPRQGHRNQECERCGSFSHAKAICPTLWRLYVYNPTGEFERLRAKRFFRLQGHSSSASSSNPARDDHEPDPEEVSDSEEEFELQGQPDLPPSVKSKGWEPAERWCYNCSQHSNHWGDDCPEPRTNPTRTNGEPSAFSEFVSRWGPFSEELPEAPPLAGYRMPSSQFTFSVGGSATMHVAGTAGDAPANAPRGPAAMRSQANGSGSRKGGDYLSLGNHTVSAPGASTPAPSSSSKKAAAKREADDGESFRWFGRVKAIYRDGGYLTNGDKKRGFRPLPEYLFREWLREMGDANHDECRRGLERRAEREGFYPSGTTERNAALAGEKSSSTASKKSKKKKEKSERELKEKARTRQKREERRQAKAARAQAQAENGGSNPTESKKKSKKRKKDSASGSTESTSAAATGGKSDTSSKKQKKSGSGTMSDPISIDDDDHPPSSTATSRGRRRQHSKKGNPSASQQQPSQKSEPPPPASNGSESTKIRGGGSKYRGGYL